MCAQRPDTTAVDILAWLSAGGTLRQLEDKFDRRDNMARCQNAGTVRSALARLLNWILYGHLCKKVA